MNRSTLAALVGAGGYGAPIVSGLALNDLPTILTGAIPAALIETVIFWMAASWIFARIDVAVAVD